jgi:hypothetical protein
MAINNVIFNKKWGDRINVVIEGFMLFAGGYCRLIRDAFGGHPRLSIMIGCLRRCVLQLPVCGLKWFDVFKRKLISMSSRAIFFKV